MCSPPGYHADVITLDADPVADIGVLAGPGHVTGVWTRGHRVKGTAV
jgi:imidazolonepropionase-like amidohydrolase